MAAEQENADALLNLGVVYYQRRGVPKDLPQAFAWYQQAADRHFPDAQFMLGWMYAREIGVTRDLTQAVKWYRRAAEQGVTIAQYYLAMFYTDSEVVPMDRVQAHMWFAIAARDFPPGSQRDDAVRLRDGIAKFMTAEQIAEAIALAEVWTPKKEESR